MINVRNAAFTAIIGIMIVVLIMLIVNVFSSYGKVFERKELCNEKGGVMTSNSKCVQEIKM